VKNLNLIFDNHLLFLLVVEVKGTFPLRKGRKIWLHMSLLLILFVQKDDFGNYINDEIDDNKDLDTSTIILGDSDSHCYDTSVVLCSHKDLINYEESDVEGHEHVFPPPYEIVEQQEIYKFEDDTLELEQGQASNAGDIPIHFKQQDERYQGCFATLYGCESHEFNELFQ
jgi:hypothetical protein